jgi:hypothetical protein
VAVTRARPTGSAAGVTASRAGTGKSRQTPIRMPKASALRALRICCERSPIRMPRHRSRPKASTRATPTGTRRPVIAGSRGSRYSVKTIAPRDTEAQVESQSLQPTTNPGYSPKQRRTNTYWPPDWATIAPGSAREIAPSSAYSPPMIHTPRNKAGLGSPAATSPGVRRIPIIIVLPMITAMPKETPNTWSSFPRLISVTSGGGTATRAASGTDMWSTLPSGGSMVCGCSRAHGLYRSRGV